MSRSVGLRRPAGGPWTRFLQLVGHSWFRSVGAALPFWRPEFCPGLAGRPWQYLSPLPARASWSASTCRPGSSQPADSLPSLPRPSTPGAPSPRGHRPVPWSPSECEQLVCEASRGPGAGCSHRGWGDQGPRTLRSWSCVCREEGQGGCESGRPLAQALPDGFRTATLALTPSVPPRHPCQSPAPSLGPLSSRAAATYSS